MLVPEVRRLNTHPICYNGKQARLVEQGFTVIHIYMGSRWEYRAIRRYLTETRAKDSWMMTAFGRASYDDEYGDQDIMPNWCIYATWFDIFVRDDPSEIENFITTLPQRTVEFIVPRREERNFSSPEFAFLKRINHQIFDAEPNDSNDEHYIISAEDNPRALVELRLKI